MLLALTVVGRVILSPEEPLDALLGTAFNAHQRRGGKVGPEAVAVAVDQLRRTGAEVIVRPSPWRLDAARAGLAAEWLGGWVAAACEQEPALAAEAGGYRDRRLAQAAAATLAVLVWRLGTGPFLDGLRTVDGGALVAASGLAVFTTVCCAWRWRVVARGLGIELPLGTAVAAYYRSLFLNVTLPGGIVGDVH